MQSAEAFANGFYPAECANAKAAGKIKKSAVRMPGPSKKVLKKKEQRARLLGASSNKGGGDAMQD